MSLANLRNFMSISDILLIPKVTEIYVKLGQYKL